MQVVLEGVGMLRPRIGGLQPRNQRVLVHIHVHVERIGGHVRLLASSTAVRWINWVLRFDTRHQAHGRARRLPQILGHLILRVLSRHLICVEECVAQIIRTKHISVRAMLAYALLNARIVSDAT